MEKIYMQYLFNRMTFINKKILQSVLEIYKEHMFYFKNVPQAKKKKKKSSSTLMGVKGENF